MKLVIAPDSFKDSLTSQQVIDIVARSARQHFPHVTVAAVPIADGGDGTVEALVRATNGRMLTAQACDPLGRVRECVYGEANGAAVIGMSEISGLALLTEAERNPMETSSHGTGDLLRHALDAGYTQLLVGIGGSATNDGGTGALQALGMRFYREDGSEIDRMCGRQLAHAARLDASGLDARLQSASITVMCDVTNPLTGSNGATYVYGPQKGGSPQQLDALEAGMLSFGRLVDVHAGYAVSAMPGAGAAGGMGAALHAFAGARLVRGIDAVLELVRFDALLTDADLVVTGEGRVDAQSASGKVIHGVATRAKAANVPVVVIAGGVGDGADAVYALGVSAIVPLPDAPMPLDTCIQDAAALMARAADRAFSLIRIGQGVR